MHLFGSDRSAAISTQSPLPARRGLWSDRFALISSSRHRTQNPQSLGRRDRAAHQSHPGRSTEGLFRRYGLERIRYVLRHRWRLHALAHPGHHSRRLTSGMDLDEIVKHQSSSLFSSRSPMSLRQLYKTPESCARLVLANSASVERFLSEGIQPPSPHGLPPLLSVSSARALSGPRRTTHGSVLSQSCLTEYRIAEVVQTSYNSCPQLLPALLWLCCEVISRHRPENRGPVPELYQELCGFSLSVLPQTGTEDCDEHPLLSLDLK